MSEIQHQSDGSGPRSPRRVARPNIVRKRYFGDCPSTTWWTRILPKLDRIEIEGVEFITLESVARLTGEEG